MKTTNYSYTTELTSQSKKPRVTLAISFDNDDTDIVYVTSHDDGIGPDGELVIQGALLKDSLSNNTQKLDIDKSTSTIGQLTFFSNR